MLSAAIPAPDWVVWAPGSLLGRAGEGVHAAVRHVAVAVPAGHALPSLGLHIVNAAGLDKLGVERQADYLPFVVVGSVTLIGRLTFAEDSEPSDVLSPQFSTDASNFTLVIPKMIVRE